MLHILKKLPACKRLVMSFNTEVPTIKLKYFFLKNVYCFCNCIVALPAYFQHVLTFKPD